MLAHVLFVEVYQKARFDTQIFAHQPIGGGDEVGCQQYRNAGQKAMQLQQGVEDEVQRSRSNEQLAEYQEHQRQMVSAFFEPKLGEQIAVAGTVDKHSTQNRRHDDKGGCCGQQSAVRQL